MGLSAHVALDKLELECQEGTKEESKVDSSVLVAHESTDGQRDQSIKTAVGAIKKPGA